MLNGKRILLIIGGGIAAFKLPELIRRLRERGASVTPVLTKAAQEFVTPLTIGSLAGEKVYTDLFDLTDEAERAISSCRAWRIWWWWHQRPPI